MCHCGVWHQRKMASQQFHAVCTLFQQKPLIMEILEKTGSSQRLNRETWSLYLHTTMPASIQAHDSAKLSSVWINSKVRFDFQNFLHIQAQLQPIYSPVFQCVSLSINNHSRLQDWSLHLIGNKKTPQFWLGFSLCMRVEALTQLCSHHLLFPALQLFRPMKPCYSIKNRALHM